MSTFHCPNCQRNWNSGPTRDHYETWCWVCQADAHEVTTIERDRYRELLTRIRQWDHLDNSGDGPFWKREIDAALAQPTEGTP